MKLAFLALVLACRPLGSAEAGDFQQAAGTKGPVELTLELASSEIRVGEAPRIAVQIKNVGTADIQTADELFSSRSSDIAFAHERARRPGVYFELKGPGDSAYRYGYPKHPHECLPWNRQKSGPPGKIKFSEGPDGGRDPSEYAKTLRPGEHIRTKDWVFEPIDAEICERIPRALPAPVVHEGAARPGFQELGAFRFERPGKYKLRAVYDRTQAESLKELEPRSWEVKTATKWLTFHVTK